MTNNARRHPFQIGEQYRNEIGVYTVVQIEEPDMVIEYEDGSKQHSSIRLQARIWERIQHEQEIAKQAGAARKATRRRRRGRSRASFGRDFEGLQESDFCRDLTGTSWRRRSELGGLLALRLAEMSGKVIESRAVPRRPQVYIVEPQHYEPDRSLQAAKFLFGVTESEAYYGFYIEKSDEPMDATWDWPRFVSALADDKNLQARTLIAMEHDDLRWKINVEKDEGSDDRFVSAEQDSLYLESADGNERTPMDWAGFVKLLEAVPEDAWCNVYLLAHTEMAEAIDKSVELASDAARVYNDLLPLYAAAVRR